MKKLAVLMPTFNAAAYLKDSIDSILCQTFMDFDLYVYDDCSTDNTEKLISEYNDSRVYYRKNRVNLGIAKTLNSGVEELLPHYEYIARMDADDWSYPERFQKQIDFLESNQQVIICGTQGYWLKDLNINPHTGWEYPTRYEYISYYLLFAASFGHSSVIFRSDSFKKNNLSYDETIETCEDWDLWIRIAKIGAVANLPEFLMKYRILENSNHRSIQKVKKHFEERSRIISNYWSGFGIDLKPEEIFDYYYGKESVSKSEFLIKIKKLISVFNTIYVEGEKSLLLKEKENFSYMLARRILDFWKRSKVSRYDLMSWKVIVNEVKFMNKIKLIRSIIR